MFRPIWRHPQVYSWYLKYTEREMYVIEVHKIKFKLLNIVKVIDRNNMDG